MNRINILEYLTDVLGSLGSKPASALTPLAWEAARKQIQSISQEEGDTAQGGAQLRALTFIEERCEPWVESSSAVLLSATPLSLLLSTLGKKRWKTAVEFAR